MKQLTFDDVCKQLKKSKGFHERLDDLSALSGAAILLLGARGASGDISVFLDALTVKDQLINIGKNILGKIVKEKTNECDKRINQIRWAYSIIYYTAFFDVLDEQMPVQIREAIRLSLEEKKAIFENANWEKQERDSALTNTEIFFPNIVYGYADIEKHLEKLYHSMCEGLIKFVHMLSFAETSSEKTILEFNDIVKRLPQLAIERFQAQYLYLAGNFNEFYIYMQMEHDKMQMVQMEALYKDIISIGCNTDEKLDVGLEYLGKVLLHLPEKIKEDKVKDIVNGLLEKYKDDIEKPIIDSKDEKLIYPSIHSAFIPQSYKILEYSGGERLEKRETWDSLDECNDMDSFWARYYVSHYSLENLLLILGEPGGGKSLLTKIICARMSDRNNIFVRIPLREVSVEKEIEDIVCEQIQKDGDAAEQLPTYKWFAENFKYNPITLVFDGYDEVLQATGGVYRNFLRKILKFQEQCAERHRPVRVVVTSRETLIDKADIPVGSIVLKLLEFNERQREEWIKIWNRNNAEVYRNEQINAFMVPDNNSSIDELSRQPLLLLMLAIYDANLEEGTNSLGQEENLNRTKLYNELLRRFIRRELRKGARGDEVSYEESTEKDREIMVDSEMEKLGIAALGMFIRGKLSLKVCEMERDLKYMESKTPTYKNIGKMLYNAEGFFGSFFFIHDSQSGNTETDDKEVAFEFLHKTFYEFLVADLVLKYLIKAMDELDAMRNSKRRDSYQKAINDPNHFDKQYYTALMSAYLCAEPEIIEMIVEWKENVIKDCFQGERFDYDIIIEELFNKQIEMLCNGIFMPSIWTEQMYDNTVRKSYMQYCATYFMNLLILQTVTTKDSKRIIWGSDWSYISQFWKMNIQEDILLKFTSLFRIANEPEGVCIKKKQITGKAEQKNLLEKQKDIFNFLQDDISYGLYCLHDVEVQHGEKQEYRKFLSNKGINMEFELLLGELKEYLLGDRRRFSIEKNIRNAFYPLSQSQVDEAMVLDWLLCINSFLERLSYPFQRYGSEMVEMLELVLNRYSESSPIVSEAFKCCRKIGDAISVRGKNRLRKIQQRVIYNHPQLLIESPDLIEYFLAMEDREMIIKRLRGFLDRMPFDSWDFIVKLLKIFYILNAEREADFLLQHIIRNVKGLFNNSPKAAIDILQLCVSHGRMEEAAFIVEKGVDIFERLLRRQPGLVVEFLEVACMTKETQQYVQGIVCCLDREFEELEYENPKLLIRALRIIMLFEDKYKYKKLISRVYKGYDIVFHFVPKEAIVFLKITNQVVRGRYLKPALEYSLERFHYLVAESVDAAVDLLLLCNEKETDIKRCPYIRICFNYILHYKSSVDTLKVFELMDSLREYELDEMAEFLEKRYLYIRVNFPELAKKIAKIYSNSGWRDKFTR